MFYSSVSNLELELHKKSVTRGHNLKLVNSRCHYDLKKYSFAVRVVNIWNSSSSISEIGLLRANFLLG